MASCPVRDCNTPIPAHVDRCVGCGRDVGSPNVRAANAEAADLDRKYRDARTTANQNGVLALADELELQLTASHAVFCRNWSAGAALLSSDKKLYSNFYGRIDGESDLPEDNEFDAGRESVDALLFPQYHKRIRFGALSLNGTGAFGYGDCAILLKENSIRERASVFWENAMLFTKDQKIVAGSQIPPGFRASWLERAKLGIAKLAPRLRGGMNATAFQELVMDGTGRTSDVIEVHVYGPIHRRTVASVIGRHPSNDVDERIVNELEKTLRADNVPFQLMP